MDNRLLFKVFGGVVLFLLAFMLPHWFSPYFGFVLVPAVGIGFGFLWSRGKFARYSSSAPLEVALFAVGFGVLSFALSQSISPGFSADGAIGAALLTIYLPYPMALAGAFYSFFYERQLVSRSQQRGH